jgi:hypothetical protein
MFSGTLVSGLIQLVHVARARRNERCVVTRYLRDPPVISNRKKTDVEQKEKKSLTPGWVVYGKRRHAEPPEEDVPA